MPIQEAAEQARQLAIEEYGPDNPRTAIIFEESDSGLGQQVEKYFYNQGYCDNISICDLSVFYKRYNFLWANDSLISTPMHKLPQYANEIGDGKLFLGSRECVNERAIADLEITHVVSVIDRPVEVPESCQSLFL